MSDFITRVKYYLVEMCFVSFQDNGLNLGQLYDCPTGKAAGWTHNIHVGTWQAGLPN